MAEKIPVSIDADLADLIPGFLENRERDVARLKTQAANGAFSEARTVGHGMKGSGGGYGFDRISELGAQVETAALAADAGAILDAVAELEDYLARVEIRYVDT